MSVVHKLVNNYLKTANVEYLNEHIIGNLVVDIFLPKYKIVLEIEGPTHYVYPTNELTLNTISRNTIIKSLGYELLQIDSSDGLMKSLDDLAKKLENSN